MVIFTPAITWSLGEEEKSASVLPVLHYRYLFIYFIVPTCLLKLRLLGRYAIDIFIYVRYIYIGTLTPPLDHAVPVP